MNTNSQNQNEKQTLERIATQCGDNFRCMLKKLKKYNMKNMLYYLLDYLKKNYNVENIINEIDETLSNDYYYREGINGAERLALYGGEEVRFEVSF